MNEQRADAIAAQVQLYMRVLIILLVGVAIGIVVGKVSVVYAQNAPNKPASRPAKKPGPVPLGGQPSSPVKLSSKLSGAKDKVEAKDKLKISYLCEVPRGSKVRLVLMSGVKVEGKVVLIKEEHDVIVLEMTDPNTRQTYPSYYKAVAVAGCENIGANDD